MSIVHDAVKQSFHLQTKETSYVIQIVKNHYVAHVYWGKRIRQNHLSRELQFVDRAFVSNPVPGEANFSLDTLPQEYPAYGNTDFRVPAVQIGQDNGSTITDFAYRSHRIFQGKPVLEGLPATYVENEDEAETLEIDLVDQVTGLCLILSYTVFEQLNALTRSVRFVHEGTTPLKLLRSLSMNVDFPDADYELLHLSGTWANERGIVKRSLAPGQQAVESRRGASSHQHNPFIALLRPDATEDHGEVFAANLVYSGNFLAQVEVDQYRTARLSLGINPFEFSWLLEPGGLFQTPEAVLAYSDQGLGGMSRTFHKLYRTRLCRGTWRDRDRPVLINNWEATYFNFTADTIESIASKGKELGLELFVLDDGWFGKRDDDTSSLGDWFVDQGKLPNGLDDLARRVTKRGMQFGLWFEPEMISEDSDLYRKYPDWCLHVPNRHRSTGRNQLVLDYSRQDVCDAVVEMISSVLNSAPISYVKWDMNRHMTEVGSAKLPPERQRETAHRYMLGLYHVLEQITSKFPEILFESCSGGGGRYDPGMLYYMPQTWTSDNTDAVSRLKIQYGTSLIYPASSMGAHVSAVPNHQLHRNTSLQMRGDVAMFGNFGYELDLTTLSEQEQDMVTRQVASYKEIRHVVQFGDFYRLLSPFEDGGKAAAWMYVTDDRSEAVAAYYRVWAEPNPPLTFVKFKGLDPERDYRVNSDHEIWLKEDQLGGERIYGGDELMYVGISVPVLQGDFRSVVWRLKALTHQ